MKRVAALSYEILSEKLLCEGEVDMAIRGPIGEK